VTGISASTPIRCRVCDLRRPLWSPIKGVLLPGHRCKCISLEGTCEKIANARQETPRPDVLPRRAR
jgi:hypothetical protein